MNVLVTGAAGFIGSNLVHLMLRERPSWNVIALDALTYAGNLENLASPLKEGRLQFVRADITDAEQITNTFKKFSPELVFHLAAESHVDRSILSAAEFVGTNVQGTQVLLTAAREYSVKRFIHISTDEVYGSLGPTGFFYETTPLDPTSPYAASKAASDLMVLACHKTHKLDTVITRCTNNYGPYQFPEKVIPLFITNALEDKKLPLYGDGLQVRSWIYVEDHCQALIQVAEKGRSGEVYNIGGPKNGEITNLHLTKSILSAMGKPESLIQPVEDRLAHDRRYAVDIAKIKNELGWEPVTQFDDGLKRTVTWYLENRVWWSKIKSGEYRDFYDRQYGERLGNSA